MKSRWLQGRTLALGALASAASVAASGQAIRRAPAFANDALVDPPTADWATNGGDWYNRRYSPLAEIDRDNVAN